MRPSAHVRVEEDNVKLPRLVKEESQVRVDWLRLSAVELIKESVKWTEALLEAEKDPLKVNVPGR